MNALDRRALFTSGAAAALLASTGLSAAGTGPKPGGRLRAALSGACRTDSWGAHSGLFMHAAAQGAVFDTLTEISASGTLRGELAAGWEGSPDARTWLFDLREGVTFHNGAFFTARDVVASMLRRQALSVLPEVSAIKAITPHQVQIELHAGNADLPYMMSDPRLLMYPADDTEIALQEGIGTGLYRVKQFQPGRQFLGVRVAEHYKDGHAGWFEPVVFTSVRDALGRAQALEGGYGGVAGQIDPSGLSGQSGVVKMLKDPDGKIAVGATSSIGMPDTIGQRWPMDNARMAERWWML
jgi:peptide/nickel transport system substrate-binding protein